jgi:hypothetical protein
MSKYRITTDGVNFRVERRKVKFYGWGSQKCRFIWSPISDVFHNFYPTYNKFDDALCDLLHIIDDEQQARMEKIQRLKNGGKWVPINR